MSHRRAGSERQRQRRDHRIARASHVEDLLRNSRNVRHMAAFLKQAHPALSTGNEDRLASQALMKLPPRFQQCRVIISMQPRRLDGLQVIGS